jgi:hypothetical protein
MNSKFSDNMYKKLMLSFARLTSPIFCLTASTSFLPFSVSFFTVEDALEAPEALLDSEADRKKWRIVKVSEHEISGGVTFTPCKPISESDTWELKEQTNIFQFALVFF